MPHDLCKARGWMRRLALGLTVLAAVGAEAQQSKKKAALPTFPDGPNKGRYAVYQHAKFNAWIDATGTPWVQPLDAGKPVGKPFSCHAVSPYYNPEAAHKGRPIAEFISPAPPAVIPATGGKIKLQGKLEEDVPFEVEYEFKGNVIIAAGGCKDHSKVQYPTRFRLLSSFPATHNFTNDTPRAIVEAQTAGLTVELKGEGKKGETQVIPYALAKSLGGNHEYVLIRGPYAPRAVLFKPVGREGSLGGWLYPGRAPWQGFLVLYSNKDQGFSSMKNKVSVQID